MYDLLRTLAPALGEEEATLTYKTMQLRTIIKHVSFSRYLNI